MNNHLKSKENRGSINVYRSFLLFLALFSEDRWIFMNLMTCFYHWNHHSPNVYGFILVSPKHIGTWLHWYFRLKINKVIQRFMNAGENLSMAWLKKKKRAKATVQCNTMPSAGYHAGFLSEACIRGICNTVGRFLFLLKKIISSLINNQMIECLNA